jgi:hypothetical protein
MTGPLPVSPGDMRVSQGPSRARRDSHEGPEAHAGADRARAPRGGRSPGEVKELSIHVRTLALSRPRHPRRLEKHGKVFQGHGIGTRSTRVFVAAVAGALQSGLRPHVLAVCRRRCPSRTRSACRCANGASSTWTDSQPALHPLRHLQPGCGTW